MYSHGVSAVPTVGGLVAGPSPADERHLVLFHVLVVGTHDHGVPGEAVLWGMGVGGIGQIRERRREDEGKRREERLMVEE